MDRIDHPSALNRRWVAKDPNIPNSGTVITKNWLQSIDDELINLIEKSGIDPASNDLEQIYKAVVKIATDKSNESKQAAKFTNPIIRLTKNQSLMGNSGSPPTGWSAHPNCIFENVCNVGSNADPNTRHPFAQELLDSIGIKPVVSLGLGFNIWRISWPANTPYLMYQFLNCSNYTNTVAAYTKLESGSVSGAWAHGATAGEWKLTGQQTGGNMLHAYWMIHPIPSSAAGSLLFALPAAVIGVVDINDNKHWSLYPYIGDTQYD